MFRGWESERILSPQALKKACAKVKSWLKTGEKKMITKFAKSVQDGWKKWNHWEVEGENQEFAVFLG